MEVSRHHHTPGRSRNVPMVINTNRMAPVEAALAIECKLYRILAVKCSGYQWSYNP